MPRIPRLSLLALALTLAAVWLAAPPAGADDRKLFVGFREIPYVFILFDNSSSMASVTECSAEDLAAGFCSQLCDVDGGGCMAPLNADDDSSKLYEAKEILYQVLLETENVDFGFATLNQDDMRVRSKHWLYEATNDGPTLPGTMRQYPEKDTQEVFGRQWPCTSGSDVGCSANAAADLDDPCDDFTGDVCDWERVQRLPRGDINATGTAFDATTTFYVADGNTEYRVHYDIPSGVPGETPISAVVTVCESNPGGNCVGTQTSATVIYALVGEFLSMDLGPDPNGNQNDEFDGVEGFFAELDNVDVEADTGTEANGVGRCGGLDMNDDTDDDIYIDPYNLRWPTIAGGACSGSGDACTVDGDCPAGETCDPAPLLDLGDFIPFDWRDSHKQDILSRLAPTNALGEPDFSMSGFFEDPSGSGPNGALDLLDPNARPILPTARTPLEIAIEDFREWYDGCRGAPGQCGPPGWEEYAETRDPNWPCRKKYLLIFTDGDEACDDGDNGTACDATSNLNSQADIETFVIAYGISSDEGQPGGTLTCLPANSGAGNGQEIGALFPHNRQELLDALKLIFSAIVGRTATFSAAAVPSVQAEALDKLFVTSLSPVNEQSVWPGRLDAFVKPMPLDEENKPDTSPEAGCDPGDADDSGCHIWNAAQVMFDEQLDDTDPVGQEAGKRRVFYSQFPVDGSVPWTRETFETFENRMPSIEVERDFWRGLGIVFTPGDEDSEADARAEADAIVTQTLAAKTGVLPPPEETEVTYIQGEIFHSDPLVVGAPTNTNYFIADLHGDNDETTDCTEGDPGYRCFFFRHQKRRKAIAAGSNDGMLHVWDAGAWRTSGDFADRFDNGSGKEIFAYMPRTVLPVVRDLAQDLTGPEYAVDGRPAAADVFTAVAGGEAEWRTVLTGGLRNGGWTTIQGFSHLEGPPNTDEQKASGYYLLDITQPDPVTSPGAGDDPTNFVPDAQDPPACLQPAVAGCGSLAYGTPLWEFTDTILGEREGDPLDPSDDVIVGVRLDEDANGFVDLAPTWSVPNIGRMRVCVGAVCNPLAPDNDVEERFVAIFGGGLDEKIFHDRGNFLYIVDVETGETIYKHELAGSAPSEPAAVDTNFDGFLDTIYIGTTFGLLYRVDLEQVIVVGGEPTTIVPSLVDTPIAGVMADGTQVMATQQRIVDPLFAPYVLFNTNDGTLAQVLSGDSDGDGSLDFDWQQIYFRPSVLFVPMLDQFALAFGTGNRADLFARSGQRGRFVVYVDNVTTEQLQTAGFEPARPAGLQLVGLDDARVDDTVNFLVSHGGWWFQLEPDQIVVTEPFALAGVMLFSSFIPADQAIIIEEDNEEFCRETGTSQLFATNAANANGLLHLQDDLENAVRFRQVEDLATRPYTEVAQTANPIPDELPAPMTEALFRTQEEIKKLQPENCKYPPGYHVAVKTRITDTGIEFIAPVPICVIEKNFRDY